MGNTPSHPHGSPARPHGTPTTNRPPNLRLPMPQRPTHISPQSSNPTSPSGRPGSPRRRKSLELPDLNKLSFTPAAPLPTTATTTSHLAPSSEAASSSRKWQTLSGHRSPLAGNNALGAMSKIEPSTQYFPNQRPPSPKPPTSPDRDDEPNDGLVSVPISWTGGGKTVYVTGNFANNWKDRFKLNKRWVTV